MNCHEFELELGDYVDGVLSSERMKAVEAHVHACALCRATVADFSAIRGAAQTLEPQMPAAHVWTNIAAAVAQEQRRAVAERESGRTPWWRLATGALAWQPLVAAAVMLVLLAGGTWLAWRDAAQVPVTSTASSAVPGAGADPEVQLAEQHFSAAIGDLEKVTQ